ncbi:YfhO family protein, partial [Enterococcus cecorum]|nr:YfhO family protein [Enterococcus cecorum]
MCIREQDWVYASRSLYTDPYPAISALVGYTKQHNQDFYRLENLDPVSVNDAFHYNYAGIGLFSSMRNRHASSYLNQLGFRSRGTNLNLRYPNNTLLMDSLFDIKYNLSTQPVEKYGFSQKQKVGDYQLYENYNALELGLLAPKDIYKVQQPQFDNLASQKNLFNALSRQNQEYFKFTTVSLVQQT